MDNNMTLSIRAKTKADGSWINNGFYLFNSLTKEEHIFKEGYAFEIEHDTICRFTGLTDSHGTKFFENDIIGLPDEDSDDGSVFYYRITYDEDDCMWYLIDCFHSDMYSLGEFHADDLMLLGNVFDNPELLEDKNEEKED